MYSTAERAMLSSRRKDKIPNTIIREIMKGTDIIQRITQYKWRQASDVFRMNDNRWAKRLIE